METCASSVPEFCHQLRTMNVYAKVQKLFFRKKLLDFVNATLMIFTKLTKMKLIASGALESVLLLSETNVSVTQK